jgi:5'(3')-deoxyribonucleotidase
MMLRDIFLDMDGVLVDFMGGIHKAIGVPYSYDEYPYELGKWLAFEDSGVPFDAVNNCCTERFWENLAWARYGGEILKAVEATFPTTPITLLTTPMPNPGSWSGKYRWVEKNCPWLANDMIVTRRPKASFAHPRALLIDDRDENVDRFREAGGHAIQVPRPWNRLHGDVATFDDITMRIALNSLRSKLNGESADSGRSA